ncbi:DNA-directed RNA polymerase specialized sigma24 family protein [Kribbella aluminosa]|uniref:DNA-directed RNA polymerase specialized sigma24 family protein n=1 Tax=Kribbella aluminosa TaxID=416017 RepID=A0ABS4ULP0_9ACTN|nr:hypothetical protein [Kribbella aluminosa]MBP2352582.1 DNA-directed RNA polymerase specialized sigma24 family protein [Kribbella aluminosa]
MGVLLPKTLAVLQLSTEARELGPMFLRRDHDHDHQPDSGAGRDNLDWPADERLLLSLAMWGDLGAAGAVCDRHGAALFQLACSILGDHDDAESVVVDVIVDACTRTDATRLGVSLRHELARLTYARCLRLGSADERRAGELSDWLRDAEGSAATTMAELIAGQQRVAIALVGLGEYTCRDAAALIGTSEAAVADLVSAGLRDINSRGTAAIDRRRSDSGVGLTCRLRSGVSARIHKL